MGAASGFFATVGARCFPQKNKLATNNTMIAAAAETRIKGLEFELLGCFGRDDNWDVALTERTKGSGAGGVGAGGGTSCFSGGVVRTLLCGGSLSGTVPDEPLLDGTVPVGTFAGVTGLGAAGTGLTGLGEAGLVETALLSGEDFGGLGRGT